MEEHLKKAGSVHLKPVKGEAFDIRPSKEAVVKQPKKGGVFGWFLTIAFIFFFGVSGFFLYTYGKAAFEQHYGVALEGYEAFSAAIESAKSGDLEAASLFLVQSQEAFERLADETELLRNQALPSADQVLALKAMDLLLQAALEASDLGLEMIEFAKPLESDIRNRLTNIQSPDFGPQMIDFLHEKQVVLSDFRAKMSQIQSYLNQINTSLLPGALKLRLSEVKEQVDLVSQLLLKADDLTSGALKLLGDWLPNRVVVLFQNNRELRPTGGFAGSFGILDINDGVIGELRMHDIYQYSNQLGGDLFEAIPAPPGLDRLNSDFTLQDSNYSPDLLTSAQDFRYLLESARGPSFNTFITVDPNVAESILRLSGDEIVLQELTLNADDLVMRLMYYVEGKIIDPEDPKGIIFQLVPEFKQRIESLDAQVLQAELTRLVRGRHIQMASFDPQVQSLLTFLGVEGGMPEPADGQDFMAVVSTSISANKSDGFIESRFDHSTEILPYQPVQNNLSITKNHAWGPTEADFWGRWMESYGVGPLLSEKELTDILGAGDNHDYMRIYVPLGSKLISSEGVEMVDIVVFEDLGYTVFAFEMRVSAGNQKTVTLSYELPFQFDPDNPSYQFLARKQAGTNDLTLLKSATFDGRQIGEWLEIPFEEDIEWNIGEF